MGYERRKGVRGDSRFLRVSDYKKAGALYSDGESYGRRWLSGDQELFYM